jgi:antitoxin component YwqK of YwqJK toxin-antitoxin module
MRILYALLFVGLTPTFAVQAQMSKATHALEGPVKTVRTEVATFLPKDGEHVEGPRVLQSTASFNEDGNRTDYFIYDHKGELRRRIVMRFEGRKMLEYANYDGTGRMWLRGTNSYDEAGQIKESASFNGDGSLRSKKVFIRNKEGQLIELAEYSASGVLMERIINTFHAGEQKTSERSVYFPDGSLQLTEARDLPRKRVDSVNYNPNGSVASKSIRIDTEIVEYSKDGSLLKTTSISKPDRLLDEVKFSRDGATKRESQIPDQLDSRGNWIKQTTWLTDANGTRPVKVTYRTITYYEKFRF